MYLKLSWIDLPRMNAFWFGEISSAIFGASRSAKILEISFATLWIIMIGLNWDGSCASADLGIRTINAPFNRPNSRASPKRMALIACSTCDLIVP